MPPPPVTGIAGSTDLIDLQPHYEGTLRRAADALPQDLGVRTRLAQGGPAAEEERCDLIVMGFHGHGRLHNALVGSVSRSVLDASALPVLLMHAPRRGERRRRRRCRRRAREAGSGGRLIGRGRRCRA